MYFQFITIDKEGIEPDYAFPSWLGQISPFFEGRKIHTGFLKKSSSLVRAWSVTKFILFLRICYINWLRRQVCQTKNYKFRSSLKCDLISYQCLLWIWSHFVTPLKSNSVVQWMGLRGWFEHKSKLRSSLKCDRICTNWCFEFGHTLLCFLGLT
jgi:hypothetical protein